MFDFQEEIDETTTEGLYQKYLVPPFSVFDTKVKEWKKGKSKWLNMGIKSELGRKENLVKYGTITKIAGLDTSIFDPFLCEILYSWFCPKNGKILDPFSGGSVRGIVASKLGFKYTGIDLRKEQIEANIEQGKKIVPENVPNWLIGDSFKILDQIEDSFDFVFSCPPYFDLEIYSDDKNDLSNMNWEDFKNIYKGIISKSCSKLKEDSFACFVVGDIRDSNGFYRDFISLTKNYFIDAGLLLYNDVILLNNISSASLRAGPNFRYKKLTKVHQNVLVFYKGNPKSLPDKEFLVK